MAVVGAGISGLSTAYRLKKNGNDVTIFEASSKTGGKIGQVYCEGLTLDLGPVTISETPALSGLISELNLKVVTPSDATSIRYIFSKGKLHRVSPKLITSSLLSFTGKLSMLRALVTSKSGKDESVAAYARRRFGEQAYQRLFNPMMNGIYAGNAELLSAHSVIKKRGPRKIISLEGGIKSLTDALAAKLHGLILTGTTIDDFSRFDKVHLTTPAFATAGLIKNLDGDLADKLASVHYSSVSQIYCEIVPGASRFDGFGFLVPSEEKLSLLGAISVSNIFPSKVPEGRMLFVLFCGGDRPYPFTPSIESAVSEFSDILKPALTRVLRVQEWKRAIPQFYVGHNKILDQIGQFEKRHPNIKITGNYVTGVAVGDCI